jgi:ABC-type spermidine/putrescine transport system permease subunit II
LIDPTPEVVTWIKVQKPSLDILGIILGSIVASLVLALLAVVLGAIGGLGLIRRRSRPHEAGSHLIRLDLASKGEPTPLD